MAWYNDPSGILAEIARDEARALTDYRALNRKAEAADAYCAAVKANEAAGYGDWLPLRAQLDLALHNLMLACDFPCAWCESGSCPGLT